MRSRGRDVEEFKLVAINEEGKIAEVVFRPKIEGPLNMQEAKGRAIFMKTIIGNVYI
jgi:hypothetical protein